MIPARLPILDSRTLNDILRQLQHEARNDVPEWEPPPAGDAGTMLQRIFARLLEIVLQRLNQVPEKHLLAFLDTMGVNLLPPSPAKVPLTFMLTPGSPPTFVPQGTQASAQPSGQQPAVIFETADDLTVIPAQLAMAFTMDPTWDRYTDQTSVLGGQRSTGFTPFVGTRRLPHILYLGDDAFLHFSGAMQRAIKITFGFALLQERSSEELQEFLQGLSYQVITTGTCKTLSPTSVTVASNEAVLEFHVTDLIDEETIQGVGLTEPLHGRWLRVIHTTPLLDETVARDLRLRQLKVIVSASNLLPEVAFNNSLLVDMSKDFLPFGETPKVGDAFYLASEEAFAQGAIPVTIGVSLRPLPAPMLVWEYFDPGRQEWVAVSIDIDSDETAGFTKSGAIFGTAHNLGAITLHDINAFWVRVRLAEGVYKYPPISTFHIRTSDGGRRPPQYGIANQTRIDFQESFLPFGRPGDVFYFGEQDGFPVVGESFSRIEVHITLESFPYVRLEWEYLNENRWVPVPTDSDTTDAFRSQDGTVSFKLPPVPQKAVNGQVGYWVRVRIADGDYGVPLEFIPVDPRAPQRGFKVKPGTGNLNPPIIAHLSINYTAESIPRVLTQDGFFYRDRTEENKGSGFAPFVSVKDPALSVYADVDPAFYLGFDAAFLERPTTLYVAVKPRAFAGSVVKQARAVLALSSALSPLRWEYFNGRGWTDLSVIDETNDLTESGTLKFLTPIDLAPLAKFDLTPRYWVRARSPENDPFDTQQLLGVFFNTISALQAVTVSGETLDSSSGVPNQTVRLARTPVLPGPQVMVREPEPPSDRERAILEQEEGESAVQERPNPLSGEPETWVRWHEVANFVASDPHSRHYTLDHTTGLLIFGDGRRGLIPPPGTNNLLASYRTGGGVAGNVPKAGVAQLRSPLPGIAAVTNPVAADGGAEVETLAMVEERGPQTLKHRDRAVAAGDFEWLARQAAGTRVARVKCLSNVNRDLHFEPGWVTLLVVPQGAEGRLSPSSELIREIEDSLEARVFVGLARSTPARLNIIGPGYIQVTVVAQVVPQDIDEAEAVKQQVRAALDAFLHPLRGGPNGTGWVFGRDVYESEVYKVIEDVPGVSHVKTLSLIASLAQRRLIVSSPPRTALAVPENSLVRTNNRQKAALLAEPVPIGTPVDYIAVKGFKEGDHITKVLDLTTPRPSGTTIAVDAFVSDAAGFPRRSIVMTLDGRLRTRLAASISGSQSEIVVEDATFARSLQATDVLTVLYPFAMTVRAVSVENGHQALTIESYETTVALPPDTVLATLDNRVRLPLLTEIQGNHPVTVITLRDFEPEEELFILPGGHSAAEGATKLTIQAVEPVTHIVYLDDNFLVYPGVHRFTMVSDAGAAS